MGSYLDSIVERLRERAAAVSDGPMASTMERTVEWQAATEIERLQARVARLEGALRPLAGIGDYFAAAPNSDPDPVRTLLWTRVDSHGGIVQRLTVHDALVARAALVEDE